YDSDAHYPFISHIHTYPYLHSFPTLRSSDLVLHEEAELMVLRAQVRVARSEDRGRGKVPADVAAIGEERVSVEELLHVVVGEADDRTGLGLVVAAPFHEPRVVVPDRRALLDDELLGVASANPEQSLKILANDSGILGPRIPSEALIRCIRLVQERGSRDLPLALHRVDAVVDVL